MKLENYRMYALRITFLAFILLGNCLFAGQTGKLSGKVTDNETGETIIGANIIIEGTFLGAAADIDGYYYINNIPPGEYIVFASAVGFRKTTIRQVNISIDKTTNLDIELTSEAVELDGEVVVIAQKPLIVKDLTSSAATVTSKEIQMMPVDDIHGVVNLQAGVVAGHFRGGRSNEVGYLIDGIPVTDAYSGNMSVEVENNSVRELEVISGTFNAEYGQAMSGIVNIVTKEGSTQKFDGSVSAYFGNYVSQNDGIYENLDQFNSDGIKDIQFSLSGPSKIVDNLTFFLSGRYFDDGGYFYGQQVYDPSDSDWYDPSYIDYNPLLTDEEVQGLIDNSEFVSMNPWRKYSVNGKITYSLPSWKFSYTLFWDEDERTYYDHGYRWTPEGIMNHFSDNMINNFQISFFPSQSTFTTLKFSANSHNFNGYLYEDEFDSRYVDPQQGQPTSGYTYRHGGNQASRYERYTKTYIGQWALESQLSKEHKVKLGIEGRFHEIFDHGKTIVNLTEGQIDENNQPIFTLGYRNPHTADNQSYKKNPYEFSAFLQDKMEYDIMIINAGIRVDYFNANSTMPADSSNVLNNPDFPGAGETVTVDPKIQVSPRIGLSFPISDKGAIYFSYGHFFQVPPYEFLYRNDEYIITQGQSLSSNVGNPDLEAQQTIQYEIGLQQVVFPNTALHLTVYYRDIRNLLGMEIINTVEGFKYGRFTNRDYGNTQGFIVTLDKRFADYFSAKIDYTFQVAEGNASDPMAVYNDNQSDPPVESEKHLVPLDWDQVSTINFTSTIGKPGDWTIGLIVSYGSGTPYTEDVRSSNGVRFENGGRKPTYLNADVKADKFFKLFGVQFNAYLLVFNMFDNRNEYGVYSSTGRANVDLNVKYAGDVNGLNTIDQYVKNPGMYSQPRQIRLGFRVGF